MSVINAWLRNGIQSSVHPTSFSAHLISTTFAAGSFVPQIPVAARSTAWVCGRSLAGIVDSNPAGGMDVSCKCCLLSDIGLCAGPFTRREGSYRVW
jgi:hypothetical protein